MKKIITLTFAVLTIVSLLVIGVSAASERESNNTANAANSISVNTDVVGSISTAKDVDWYRFELPKDGYIVVEFKHELISESTGYWNLRLYQADAVTGVCGYEQKWAIPGNANGQTSQIGLSAGVYYFKVVKGDYRNSDTPYTFNVKYTESEYTELESNSTSKSATEVELNKDYTATIAGVSDEDWYRFELPKDGYIVVDFKHELISESAGYWNLRLYQADAVTGVCGYEQKWAIPGNANGQTSQIGLSAGVYYFKVVRGDYRNSDTPYTFNVKYTESEYTELESNSTSKSATEVELNKDYTATIAGVSDEDWYRFELPKDGYIVVDFKHELISESSGYWNLRLYQADAVTGVCGYEQKWAIPGNANGQTSQIGLSAGVYYFKVVKGDYRNSDTPYIFNVKYTESEYTELEANSSAKSATLIKVNREYLGAISGNSDEDWFSFTLSSSADVTLNLSHDALSSSSVYWRVNLYGSDGVNSLYHYDVTGKENGAFAIGTMQPGTYLIKVNSGPYNTSDVQYKLSVTEKHDCSGSFTITKEPTCTQSGEQQRLCDTCGKSLETQTVAPAGHRSEGWTVDVEATCNNKGKRHGVCSVCNESVTEEIEKLEHSFGGWAVTKESTCKVSGSEERVCSLCGHKEEKSIEMLEHKFDDWEVISGNVIIPPIVKEQECELCGYTETVKDWGYVWVTALAAIALIGLCVGVVSYFKAYRNP